MDSNLRSSSDKHPVALTTIAAQWLRIGCIGFGGPPTHIALLRRLCVDQKSWITPTEFEDGVAATNLLPGPASTQLAIFCAWRLAGSIGAVIGGVCFIVPGLVVILALSSLFLESHPPHWVLGAAGGAGSAVAAVALDAAIKLAPSSWKRIGSETTQKIRWSIYALMGGAAAATIGPFLVLVLLACGLFEMGWRSRPVKTVAVSFLPTLPLIAAIAGGGSIGLLVWEAFKVGALSYGGGFVIIPLMQQDVVSHYHWMSNGQFLDAVALGQVTPGPVVQTVAVVGYAVARIKGGLIAALVAFAPSFVFVLLGARHFDRLRNSSAIQAFLMGAGPSAIGAIAGSAIPLGLALTHLWQIAVLAAALFWLFLLRRSVVSALLGCGAVGVALSFSSLPIGH